MKAKSLRPFNRREALETLSFAGVAMSLGCGSSPTSPTTSSSSSTTTTTTTGGSTSSTCAVSPSETRGPYPDQTGMISNTAFYRRDITEGRSGTPLALTLTIVNAGSGCAVVSGANVEIWQCDASGNYSEYAQPGYNGVGQTFLRGVQTSDASGRVLFNTIYPGWYQGRATHIHVDVWVSGRLVKSTQIAFPENTSAEVYRQGVYASKGQNTTSNASDNVFSDGVSLELATVTGSPSAGYAATLQIGVSI